MDLSKGAWILYERPDLTDLGMISPLDKLNLRQKAMLVSEFRFLCSVTY